LLEALIVIALATGLTSVLVIYPKALSALRAAKASCTYTDNPILGWFAWLLQSIGTFPLIILVLCMKDKEQEFIDGIVKAHTKCI
jgi:hypothetical protein